MDREYLFSLMEPFIEVHGLKINNMVKESNKVQKEFMKEILPLEINKVKVLINGKMDLNIVGNGN